MQDFSLPQAQPFCYPEGDHGVLLIHGFTGSPSHMRLIGEGLRDNSFAVRGILLPGHGKNPEAMKKSSWQDWFQASREAAAQMRAKYKYFTAVGLSMGGCLALMLAEGMEADACVTIAAPMKTVSKLRSLAPIAALAHPMVNKRADGSRKSLIADYDIGYNSYPTQSVVHLSAVMRKAYQDLSLIHCPVMVIQSRADRTVTADSPDIILNGVSSRIKAQLWLQNAPHVCTISPEYPRIVEAMTEFLRKAEQK